MKKLIVGNWKSNKTIESSRSWLESFSQHVSEFEDNAEIVIAPPFPLLSLVGGQAAGLGFKLGIQDLSQFDAGSYTGAVSIHNLQDLGVSYAILGHSERRRYFRETDHDVAGKVAQAISAGIVPLVCIDESYISSQAAAIEDDHLSQCVVVYEPLAAIGTGDNADVGNVKEVAEKIRLAFGDVKILYGGSTNSQNVGEYTLVVDGVLVGTASLDAKEFAKLVINAV